MHHVLCLAYFISLAYGINIFQASSYSCPTGRETLYSLPVLAESRQTRRLEPEKSITGGVHANISPTCTPATPLTRTHHEKGKENLPPKLHYDPAMNSSPTIQHTFLVVSSASLPCFHVLTLIPEMHGFFRRYNSTTQKAKRTRRRPF